VHGERIVEIRDHGESEAASQLGQQFRDAGKWPAVEKELAVSRTASVRLGSLGLAC
jgi:hypothetical protein